MKIFNMKYKNTTIDIFGSTWKVGFVDKIEIDGEEADGVTDDHKKIIQIATKVEAKEIEITLLHELIHAILSTGQYHEENSKEFLVEFIARSLYALVKQGKLKLEL